MNYFFSVDLGTMQDFTAISVLERVPRKLPGDSLPGSDTPGVPKYTAVYVMRHLERLPLGLDYPTISSRIKDMMSHEKLQRQSALIVDATGVGLPITQMMQQLGLAPIGVSITSGGTVTQRDSGYNVPKAELVSALNIVFQSRRIKIPVGLKLKQEFLKELERFEITMHNTGVNTYESAVASIHDDLVLSVAMGVWYAERTEGHTYFAGNRRVSAKSMKNPLEAL